MRVLTFFAIVACGLPASASQIRYRVERSSHLERELAYDLSVLDKHDAWRADSLERVFPINGPAPEYMVRFRVATTGKLKDLFGLTLTLEDDHGILVQVPLETRWKFSQDNVVRVEFLVRKTVIDRSVLTLRCGSPLSEQSYTISLKDYVPERNKP
jgi:hypothetical protein